MSIDSLIRQWTPVASENGYLVAKSKDGHAALLGRMCERDDGKPCIEIVVRAAIKHGELCCPEFWHSDAVDAQQLYGVMQGHISKRTTDGAP
ncbi:hypothetical protein [Trinickia terrae]|nr:hypothetical protein [Trinickia terrae]